MILQKNIWKHQVRDALIYWVLLPFLVFGSGLILDGVCSLSKLPQSLFLYVTAAVCLAIGTWLIQRSIHALMQFGHGTPNPHCPPKRLTTEGVYSLCRHPMFLGYDLAALGVIFLWRSPGMLFVSFPLLLIAEFRFLQKEEQSLARRYGDAFDAYQQQVPMFLPTNGKRRNT